MKSPRILAFALLLGAAGARAQGLPVVDNALNLQTRAAWVKQAADMVKQFKTLQSQLDQAKATYSALTGARGMSNLLRNPALYNYLPADAANALRANGGGMASASAIQADLKLFSVDQTGLDPNSAAARNFTARQAGNANVQLMNEQAYQAASDRIRQLDALTKSIDAARDPMAIQALQVRVQAEQAMIANEQARLSVLASAAANADRVHEQQAGEIVMKAARGPMPAGW